MLSFYSFGAKGASTCFSLVLKDMNIKAITYKSFTSKSNNLKLLFDVKLDKSAESCPELASSP